MKKNLNCSVYQVYFDAINRGAKTTEYRDIKDYWIDKLVDKSHYEGMTNQEIKDALRQGAKLHWVKYDTITFWNNGRHITKEIKDIVVQDHHTTFAIKLGKRVDTVNLED